MLSIWLDGSAFDKKVLCQKLFTLKDHASIIPSGQSCQRNPTTRCSLILNTFPFIHERCFPVNMHLVFSVFHWFLCGMIEFLYASEEKLGNKLMLNSTEKCLEYGHLEILPWCEELMDQFSWEVGRDKWHLAHLQFYLPSLRTKIRFSLPPARIPSFLTLTTTAYPRM